jgi:hypothetical protein
MQGIVETARLVLRPVYSLEAAELHALFMNETVCRYLTDGIAMSRGLRGSSATARPRSQSVTSGFTSSCLVMNGNPATKGSSLPHSMLWGRCLVPTQDEPFY